MKPRDYVLKELYKIAYDEFSKCKTVESALECWKRFNDKCDEIKPTEEEREIVLISTGMGEAIAIAMS